MAVRGVPGDLRGPGQRRDGLPVGRTHGGVPAERHLGEQQRHAEHGQCPEPRDGHPERHDGTGRADRRADAAEGAQLVAELRPVRPGRARRERREDGVAQGGQGQQQEQEESEVRPLAEPALRPARVVERLEAQSREGRGQDAAGRLVGPGAAAARHVRHGGQQLRRDDDGDHLEDTVRRLLTGAASEQRVRERSGCPQRRGLALLGQGAPACQLADGDQDPEGEGVPRLDDAVPQGVSERDEREEQRGATDREDRRRRVARGHRCRPRRRSGDPVAGGRAPARGLGSPAGFLVRGDRVGGRGPAVAVQGAGQRPHHTRVELAPRAALQLLHGRGNGPSAPVGARGGHRVEGVRDGDDPGELGDRVTGEAVRIAAAVEPLVVVQDRRAGLVQEADASDDLVAVLGVQFDHAALLGCERPVLAQDPRRDSELSDVVQDAA